MIVARPLIGAEGMGAATVGKGHRSTTYTGVRGPEMPKGQGRRRERDRQRAQLFGLARDPMHGTGYTESAVGTWRRDDKWSLNHDPPPALA